MSAPLSHPLPKPPLQWEREAGCFLTQLTQVSEPVSSSKRPENW